MSLTPKNSFAILADEDTLEIVNHTSKDQTKSDGKQKKKKKGEVSRWYLNYKQRQEEEQALKQKQLPQKSNFVVLGHNNNNTANKGAVEKSPSVVKNNQQGKASSSNGTSNNGKIRSGGDRQKLSAQGSNSKPVGLGHGSGNEGLTKQEMKPAVGYGQALKNIGVVEKEKIDESPRFNFGDSAQFPGLS